MSRRHPLIGIRTAALVAAAALAAVAGHARLQSAGPATIRPVAVGATVPTFPVKGGSVTGLFPGRTKPLVVSIQNPFTFAIKVTSLAVAVKSATSLRACTGSASNLSVKLATSLPVKVKAKASARVTVNVTMPASVSNGCQGARFSIAESAKAVRA